MTDFHTNPGLMGFAAVEEEENKIISEWHEVLRGGKGRKDKQPEKKRERGREK